MPYPYTEKDALDYINFILGSDPQDTFAYAIDVDGTAVGSIGAFRQANIHSRTAEFGYYLSEEYWGRDIMTEAVRQLCHKVFDETNILRIFAEPFAHEVSEEIKQGCKLLKITYILHVIFPPWEEIMI